MHNVQTRKERRDGGSKERNCSLTAWSEQTTHFWIGNTRTCIIYNHLLSGTVFPDSFILSIFSWRRSTDSSRDESAECCSSTVSFNDWSESETLDEEASWEMPVIIELEEGHRIEQIEAKRVARKAVSTILSEIPEELQTGDVVAYILEEAEKIARCAKIKL